MPSIEGLLPSESKFGTIDPRPFQWAAQRIVVRLLGEATSRAKPLHEASIHRARRSRIWVATFTGPAGGQVWRSTGLVDYEPALALARQWEAQARAERARLGGPLQKAGPRVYPTDRGTRAGGLTQREVARILHMSERGVREVERRALAKLRNHPLLRQLWREYLSGELPEATDGPLTAPECQALFDIATIWNRRNGTQRTQRNPNSLRPLRSFAVG